MLKKESKNMTQTEMLVPPISFDSQSREL